MERRVGRWFQAFIQFWFEPFSRHGGRQRSDAALCQRLIGWRGRCRRQKMRLGIGVHQHIVVTRRKRAFDGLAGFAFLPLVVGNDAGDDHAADDDQTGLEIYHAECTLKFSLKMRLATMRPITVFVKLPEKQGSSPLPYPPLRYAIPPVPAWSRLSVERPFPSQSCYAR